ncbi:Uncharacterised protein [Mycobacterium tuberculosis]|nr:Uncharacterised protein [Mycobacterium tuberculosis]
MTSSMLFLFLGTGVLDARVLLGCARAQFLVRYMVCEMC